MEEPKEYRMTADVSFPNPLWMRQVNGLRMNERETYLVDDSGRIILKGVTLRFLDGICLPAGTEVVLSVGRWFWAMRKDDFLDAKRRNEENIAADRERERLAIEKYHREARELNATLLPGVAWTIGQKAVLSGLSESSNGDGMRRNSVFHILLLENYSSGRLSRKRYDFLCSSDGGFFDPEHRGYCGKDGDNAFPVTCKACLKIAERAKLAPSSLFAISRTRPVVDR